MFARTHTHKSRRSSIARNSRRPSSAGVRYLFLGSALGGRPQREDHYDAAGTPCTARWPQSHRSRSRRATSRRSQSRRLALICSCGRPGECHRRLLIGKVLCERGAELHHILPDGRTRSSNRCRSRNPMTRQSSSEMMIRLEICTIGFTQTTAEHFFRRLADAGLRAAARCPPKQHLAARRLRQSQGSTLFSS